MSSVSHNLRVFFTTAALCLMTGCTPTALQLVTPMPPSPPVEVTSTSLTERATCTHTFVTHPLDHTTIGRSSVIGLYESNGSGLAINDLDNDGDLDIVLGNLGAASTILWNEGDLHFRTQRLPQEETRAVNIVDVNGDGWQDIVFTVRFAKPTYWRNTGQDSDARFVAETLPDVNNPLYAMDWGDVDSDGDLDLVAASYDTELRKHQGAIFDYRGGGVGVFVYTRTGTTYVADRLAEEADALALVLPDLNDDGRLDIIVGNDFIRPDYAWLRTNDGWAAADPFSAMTANTMSFDLGDIDNDGRTEIFATDMKPYQHDAQSEAAWLPLMGMMDHPHEEGDPQVTENVLQVQGEEGSFVNEGAQRVVDATGWSWSSKFGDLDNDGSLDIYVVNGMIADGLLAHLPNNELVEENRALRNDGHGHFLLMPDWGLGSTASGRGMSMADLDGDGDLDIVVNNLLSPAQIFENQLCSGGSLQVDLRWLGSQNSVAIGARLTLHTSMGSYTRVVRASSGYLSGDPARVHFGLPPEAILRTMEIRWPDGALSTVDALSTETLVLVSRTTDK